MPHHATPARISPRLWIGLGGALLIVLLGCGGATPMVLATATATQPPSKPYFIQKATASNSTYDYTMIDNPLTNGDPTLKLIVTPIWNLADSVSVVDDRPIGVWYLYSHWIIFNQDNSPIPNGATFNVWVVPTTDNPFLWTATSDNIVGTITTIDMPALNGDSSAWLLVTPNGNPQREDGIYDNHPIGVLYTNGQWAIFNQDLAPMLVGAAFNVVNVKAVGGYLATATPANGAGDFITLPTAFTSGSSNALIFITANWNPNSSTGVYNNHNPAVAYRVSQWIIINQDGVGISDGAAFNTITLGG